MSDILIKALGYNENVRLYGVVTTDTLNYIGDKFNFLPSSLDSFGRVLSVGVMMGGMLKGDETVTLRVEGNGPIGRILVDADAKGHVRGYAEHPDVHFENVSGTLNSTKTIGDKGNIIIIKDLKLKEPFTGYTPIINGEVGVDFAYYFSTSEQTPTAVSVGTLVGDDSRAISSGGFIVQLLPNTPEDVIDKLEQKLKTIPSMSEMLSSGYGILDILKNIADDLEVIETIDVSFKCNCSKDKFRRGLLSLSVEELEDIIEKDKKCECVCNFCLNKYEFNLEELEKIYDERMKK